MSVVADRKVVNDVRFVVPFEKQENLFLMDLKGDTFISSKKPLDFGNVKPAEPDQDLPDLFPMVCNISIPTTNFYKLENSYRKFVFNVYIN